MKARLRSFRYASNGLIYLFRNEANARFHLLAALTSIVLAYYLNFSEKEWVLLYFTIALVFLAEIMNTAVERICDLFSEKTDDRIRIIKDMSAAAVLIVSFCALGIGILLFLPKIADILIWYA